MGSADRVIAAVNAAQAAAQPRDADALVRATLDALREFLPAFWVACLVPVDPSTTAPKWQAGGGQAIEGYLALAQCGAGELRPPVSALVIESGEPLFIPSIEGMDFIRRYVDAPDADAASSALTSDITALVVPMRAGDAILGTLGAYATQAAHQITVEDVGWIQFVADHTALAIENVRFARQAIDRLARLEALDVTVHALTSSHEPAVVFDLIVDRVRAVAGIDACELMRVDAEGDSLLSVARAGFRSGAAGTGALKIDNRLLNQGFDSRRVQYLRSAGAVEDGPRRAMFVREGFVAYAAWPLVSQGRLRGALEVFHRAELTLDAETWGFVACLAAMGALAVESADRGPTRSQERSLDLSPSERLILQLVVQGWTNSEISAHIHLSLNATKSHVRRILDKTGASNRTDLARRAISEGWL